MRTVGAGYLGADCQMTIARRLRSVLATRVERGIVVFTLAFAFSGGAIAGLQSIEAERIAASQKSMAQKVIVASWR